MIEREELTFYLGRLHARTGSQKINVFLQKRKNLTIFSKLCDVVNAFFLPLPPAVCVSRQHSLYSKGSLLEEAR